MDGILAQAAGTLDLREPVGVMLIAILQYILDGEDPHRMFLS